jgi:hypothetical protein
MISAGDGQRLTPTMMPNYVAVRRPVYYRQVTEQHFGEKRAERRALLL